MSKIEFQKMGLTMEKSFFELADFAQTLLDGEEHFTLTLHAEDSTFVRFNHGQVRQAGEVRQAVLKLVLICGKRQIQTSWSSSAGGAGATQEQVIGQRKKLKDELERARFDLQVTADDPHLLLAGAQKSAVSIEKNFLPPSKDVVAAIVEEASGLDLVGLLAMGGVVRAFANDDGTRSYFEQASFHFDYSLFHDADKAVKRSIAGRQFVRGELHDDVQAAKKELKLLALPAITLAPQKVRVFLAPAAVAELLTLLSWGGFSEKEHRTKNASLIGMSEGKRSMHASVTLLEDLVKGVGPSFSEDGFEVPAEVTLIRDGKYAASLVSPRSAKEYGIEHNGAQASESPIALHFLGGNLDDDDILQRLGTGVLINNLWYCNFSDREHARVTGMTRFATFWVEDGVIKAPLNVMRFDDSLYNLFGAHLEGLTKTTKLMLDGDTYSERKTHSMRCPGALVSEMNFTL
ncbi:MAG: TldE/PmbA family protein [Deltaproteobacteria bacterium]|nr:TldE/PmbA family protein [Deltaproteobacteria bacterium]